MTLSLELERRVFRVSELNARVQKLFEGEFRSIWVAGEISGCRTAASGHYYFNLKDDQSQVRCALFKSAARFAKFRPRDGLAVLARGNLEVYEARGEYQLIVEMLKPQGAGALQLAFEQLKKKLASDGLFDAGRKRPLAKLPRRIGIITSPAGAVIQDILQVLERRFQGLHVRLFPAQVQGEGSVEQICQGISYFSESAWAHVVILARGGGSLEDLWSFNEERVARAIAGSRVPIISAVGHETDFTIADFVADCRAPTPSAAAEIVICTRESLLDQIRSYRAKAIQAARYQLLVCGRRLHQRGTERAASLVHRMLAKRAQRVDDLDYQLRQLGRGALERRRRQYSDVSRRLQASDLRLRFARKRHRQESLNQRLLKSIEGRFRQAQRRLEGFEAHLTQLSPLAVLGRGYAIVEDANRRALRSAAETATGETLRIRLHSGELDAVVSQTREEP
ncbi:MAG: exodeoxyribonuclease VII large subunit [Acidobacteriaceae bacterium]|nr:exodeoxyribonuclease VII large subunit [Acidobacteriaceae bacterium]